MNFDKSKFSKPSNILNTSIGSPLMAFLFFDSEASTMENEDEEADEDEGEDEG
jgi:hypothetical protein